MLRAIGLIWLVLMLAACSPMQRIQMPTSPVEALHQAQSFIDEANVTLIAVARVVAQQKRDNIITEDQRNRYVETMIDFSRKIDLAQDVVDECTQAFAAGENAKCDITKTWDSSRLLQQAIIILHREIARKARGG